MISWRILAAQAAQDGRYALRWFRRDAVLTGSIVLTLAFGVGVNAGVFSVLSGMVFRPRVETDSASFFQVLASTQAGAVSRLFASSSADFEAYGQAHGVTSLAAWTVASGRVGDDADRTLLMLASCGFFPLYGLDRPLAGRLFAGAECDSSAAKPVALIGEQLWRNRFRGSPDMVGKPIEVGGQPYTVVGILPAAFAGRLRGPGIWIPLHQQSAFYSGVDLFAQDGTPWLTVEGRLMPGASRAQAAKELGPLSPERKLALTNGSLFQDPSAGAVAAGVSVLVFGALGLVLLLACANVVSLLLARAVSRRYETSVRLSMGASPARLLRMAATEGVLLAALSGGASVMLAAALPATFQRMVSQMPHYPIHTDWLVFAYLAGVTLAAGLLASLVPAAESLRVNLNGSLKRQESGLGRGLRLREVLVGLQAGLSLVLIIGAALFARTERRIVAFEPGFHARDVLIAPLSLTGESASWADVQTRLARVHGVKAVALASSLFWSRAEESAVRLPGGRGVSAEVSAVSPSFFETLGIGMVKGRAGDGAVVTEASARALWPGRNTLGQRIEIGAATLVVGGVAKASDLDERSPVPRVFRAWNPDAERAVVLVRFSGDAEAAARDVTAAVEAAGGTLREAPRTIDAEMGAMGSRFGVMAEFASFFGASAFVLALIGLYGVIAFLVGQRTKEMGIRLALGASRGDIVREVLGSGLRPVVLGLVAAMPLAAALALGLGFAFRNTPTPFHAWDPVAFVAAPLLLVAGAVAAILRPALRASGVDPAGSLRQD